MTLSRTARILIAALLVAAAAFFWVNFFNQDTLPSPVLSQPSGVVAPLAGTQRDAVTLPDTDADATTPLPGSDTAALVEGQAADTADAAIGGADVAGAPSDADATTADGVSTTDGAVPGDAADATIDSAASTQVAPVIVDTAPPVVVTGAPTVVTRDLVVEDLPFLVTSPPTADAVQAEADTAGADRPQLSQRSNINPFSPIIVQAPPAAPSQNVVAQQVPDSQPVIDIVTDSNGQPVTTTSTSGATPAASSGAAVANSQTPAAQAATPAVVRAPAPRAVAPASTTVSSLPRPIPSGTLPTTPEILRDARSQASTSTPTLPDVGTLAALRVPDENQPLELAAAGGEIPRDGVVTPELLGPDRPDTSAANRAPAVPLAVGADLLSRYLRDHNVTFTGTVLGPLSVGVFRSNLYGSPVVLTLGQTLPDTDILLTDLRGYEARFSLGDRTQTLALDLRR